MLEISIVLTVHNIEKAISKTILSLISQEFKSYELIVVDNGSVDNTFKIVEKFIDDFPFIKLFKINHSNISIARNYALNKAEGKYIIFLNDDDLFKPDFLYQMYKSIKKDNSDICLCNSCEFKHNERNVLKTNFNDSLYPDYRTWDKLIKKSIIDDNNLQFLESEYFSELSFIYLCWLLSDKKVKISDLLIYHRFSDEITYNEKYIKNLFNTFIKIKEKLIELNKFDDLKTEFQNAITSILYHQYNFLKNLRFKKDIYENIKIFEKEFNLFEIKEIKSAREYVFYLDALKARRFSVFYLLCIFRNSMHG